MTGPLAPYAATEQISQGRQCPEPDHSYRSPFERDRDRIIHSAAFRRLEGKTQVFTTGLNDHYRTRLTHSIEVSQIGRTIARTLNLNETLTEAICLAHDLGHAPFGHTGEAVLNTLMKDHGGFEHNRQALRIVDFLEHPYPNFQGLNLMFETRLGLMKHSSPYDHPEPTGQGPTHPSLEGQIADIADRIAYNSHDLEDGLRSRLIHEKQLTDLPLYQQAAQHIHLDEIRDYVIRRTRLSKAVMDILVSDAIETSKEKINRANIQTLPAVLEHSEPLIAISENADRALQDLEKFLMQNMYRHRDLEETTRKTNQWLADLFDAFKSRPEKMPHYFQKMIESEGLERTVCDYIAGTTDRYCLHLLQQA